MAYEARHLMEPVDLATTAAPMHCLATVADVNPASAADASLMTVAVQSCKSRCQEQVLCRAQRLAGSVIPIVGTMSAAEGKVSSDSLRIFWRPYHKFGVVVCVEATSLSLQDRS